MNMLHDNPFRVLGICSTSTPKERMANKSKMLAFQKVGRTTEFPLDLAERLGPVERTAGAIQRAEAEITPPERRALHALFWFAESSPLDHAALLQVQAGNFAKAREILTRRGSWSSDVNLSVLAWIEGRNKEALGMLTAMLHDTGRYDAFRDAVCGPALTLGGEAILSLAVDFLKERLGAAELLAASKAANKGSAGTAHGASSSLDSMLQDKLADEHATAIERAIKEAENAGNDAPQQRAAAVTLRTKANEPLARLRGLLGPGHPKVQGLADDIAKQLRKCVVAYCNRSNDSGRFGWAIQMTQSILQIAHDGELRKQLNEDLKTLAAENAVAPVHAALTRYKEAMDATSGKRFDHANRLLDECQPVLNRLQQQGKRNELVQCGSLVVSIVLSDCIDLVNGLQNLHQDAPELLLIVLPQAVNASVSVMERMQALSMDDETRTRLTTNLKTLKNMQQTIARATRSGGQSGASEGKENKGCLFWIVM